jgi:hypothetical protein
MANKFLGDLTQLKNWVDKELTHHYDKYINEKLKVRLYTHHPRTTIEDFLANALLDESCLITKLNLKLIKKFKEKWMKHLERAQQP